MKRLRAAIVLILFVLAALCGCRGGNIPEGGSSAAETTNAPRAEETAAVAPGTTTGEVTTGRSEVTAGEVTTWEITEPPATVVPESGWSPKYGGEFGSAGRLAGETVIVSIFANDAGTAWDATTDEVEAETLRYLGIASAWIVAEAREYGSDINFVFDWQSDRELRYDVGFDAVLVRDDLEMYSLQAEYIKNNVDEEGLKKKYRAENVVYIFFFNTEYGQGPRPWAIDSMAGDEYSPEYINLYVRFEEFFSPPATYAHEILHLFGAPDMYYENYMIPTEYVNMCTEYGSLDIMFTVNMGDEITSRFTPVDAYYVGIAERPREADDWGLGYSQYSAERYDDSDPKG